LPPLTLQQIQQEQEQQYKQQQQKQQEEEHEGDDEEGELPPAPDDALQELRDAPGLLMRRIISDLKHPKCRLKGTVNNLCVAFPHLLKAVAHFPSALTSWHRAADLALARVEACDQPEEQQEYLRMLFFLLPVLRRCRDTPSQASGAEVYALIERIERSHALNQRSVHDFQQQRRAEVTLARATLGPSTLAALSAQVERHFAELGQGEEELVSKRAVVTRIEALVQAKWGAEVLLEVFGSAGSGLGWAGSDVDVCVLTEREEEVAVLADECVKEEEEREKAEAEYLAGEAEEEEGDGEKGEKRKQGEGAGGSKDQEKKEEEEEEEEASKEKEVWWTTREKTPEQRIVKGLAALLRTEEWIQLGLVLPDARVPILKLTDKASGCMCDIVVNRRLPLQNTRLMGFYAELDPRVKQLVLAVKYWAKQRGVCDAFHGTPSAYAYVNLVIHYLQTTTPAVLPCVQHPRVVVGEWKKDPEEMDQLTVDLSYCGDREAVLATLPEPATQSVAELLAGFFTYYGAHFFLLSSVS
jgi:predicted nucleotidyltransferase